MGVHILGMELPKNCAQCKLLDWNIYTAKCRITGREFSLSSDFWRGIRASDCPMIADPKREPRENTIPSSYRDFIIERMKQRKDAREEDE